MTTHCDDCLWCEQDPDRDCINPDDEKCQWCGHCLGNHAEDDPASSQTEGTK